MPVLYASMLRLPQVTSSLVLGGADVNPWSKGGRTPLMVNSANMHTPIELIQLLLDHGAEVNAQDEHDFTPLISASIEGHVQAGRTLLDNGADIDARNQDDQTALALAAWLSFGQVVEQLLERGASTCSPVTLEALEFALDYGLYTSSRRLLKQGFSVNAEGHSVSGSGSDTRSACWLFHDDLLQALRYGHYRLADLLMEYGADINARSTVEGKCAVTLEHALNHGGDHMVEYLLEHGADPSLVRPGNLVSNGTTRYNKMLMSNQSQHQSLRVEEEEPQESETDA